MFRSERPSRRGRATPGSRPVAAITACALAFAGPPALAQDAARSGKGLPIIRDAEIEQLLREYTSPILRVAGLARQNVQVVIINERAFNAFVVDGRRIFVNMGAILDAETPNQIIGVLAHEIGHIAGGHLSRLRQELANAQTASVLAILLAAGAIAAGAATGGAGLAQVGAAAMTAPQGMILRSLLSYQRAQEEQADRAAVKFLTATGQSPKGMYETFRRLADQSMFAARHLDPYLQSHPLAADRVRALEEIARTSPHWHRPDAPDLQLRHDMIRAKLSGFVERPEAVARRYPLSDNRLPARYARAISTYRFGDPRAALAQIDSLIQTQPSNPYFHELKGQALLESGRPAEAIPALRRAVALSPNPTLIRVMLGHALVATNDPGLAAEAIVLLRSALVQDKDIPDGYRYLAMAHARRGNLADADLASAQASFASGDFKTARQLAARAKTRFPVGSPGWVKADDITSFKPPSLPGRRGP